MKPLLNVCHSLLFEKTKPNFSDWKLRFIAEVALLTDEQCYDLAHAVIDRSDLSAKEGEG
jgi:hypothetical protein